jgi:hypothetical protein
MFNSIQFSAETHAKRVSTITDDRFDFERDLEITSEEEAAAAYLHSANVV